MFQEEGSRMTAKSKRYPREANFWSLLSWGFLRADCTGCCGPWPVRRPPGLGRGSSFFFFPFLFYLSRELIRGGREEGKKVESFIFLANISKERCLTQMSTCPQRITCVLESTASS